MRAPDSVIEERKTGAAFRRVEEWLSIQSVERQVVTIAANEESGQSRKADA
jgi:hypothetical protein